LNSLLSELRRRNVLRVAALYLVSAWLIAQVADVVIGLANLPTAVGRIVLIILALGFPLALALSWFFEWTQSGIRRDGTGDGSAAGPAAAGRQIDLVVIALLSVALLYFVSTHEWGTPTSVARASIAVLPFENRSARPDDLYFADGMHDDLLTQLARISSLVVISRTSVMQYRRSDKSVPQIARELGVATILEGGVQRVGDRVRVNLQLIEAESDRHLWAETYDRELTAENVFAIQSEIAAAIAAALHARLLPAERRSLETVPTRNLEAYDAYLLGRRDTATRNLEAMSRAATYYEEAIRLDPGFALAYSALSEVLVLIAGYSAGGVEERLEAAERAARRALEIDPSLGEAHTALGAVLRALGQPPSSYVGYLERGVELAPGSADARKWLAGYLGEVHREADALRHLQKAAELDPMSAIVRVNLAAVLDALGRREESLAMFRKALEIDPKFPPALLGLVSLVRVPDRLILVSELWSRAGADEIYLLEFVFAYLSLGDIDRAEQWTKEFQRVAPDSVRGHVAHLNVALSRGDDAGIRYYAEKLVPWEPPGIAMPTRLLLQADLRSGNVADAHARYLGKYPGLLEQDPEVVGEYYVAAIDVAMLLEALGEPDRAKLLLRRSLEYTDSLPESDFYDFGVHRARAQAMLGDSAAALATLERAVEAGWLMHWQFFLTRDRAFDGLRGEPRFQALATRIADDVASQLEQARQLENSGKIMRPPAAGS